MLSVNEFLDLFRTRRTITRRLIEAIPENHFGWSPSTDAFSCGDIVRHLMQAEIFWRRLLLKGVAGEPFDPFHLEGGAEERMRIFRSPNLISSRDAEWGTSFAQCLERWREIQKKTEDALAELSQSALSEGRGCHPLLRYEAPLDRLALLMLEHEAHHRGQLSAYLKMLGVEQPAAIWV